MNAHERTSQPKEAKETPRNTKKNKCRTKEKAIPLKKRRFSDQGGPR
jgi:hypothetical protein